MTRLPRLGAAIGAVIAVLSLLATSRKDLRDNTAALVETLGGWPTLVAFVAGAGLALACAYWLLPRKQGAPVLDDQEHRQAFRQALTSSKVTVVKLFGYTGETSLNDLLAYNDRYRPITVQMLLRNWLAEEADENRHNARPTTSDVRLWRKAHAIKRAALEPWPHAMRREMRFFDGPPVIKASILLEGQRPIAGFVSFLFWRDAPDDGGSAFKGVPRGVVQLDASRPNEAAVLTYLNSQFELAWRTAKTRQQVLLAEMAAKRGSEAP